MTDTTTLPPLTTIQPKNYPSASKLLAECFHDNPAHQYFCRNPMAIKKELAWLLGLNLKLQLAHGADSFCLTEDDTTKAMGFWTYPNLVKVGLWQQIKGGLLRIPFKMGIIALKRILEVGDGIDAHLHRAMGTTQSYYYLNNMVVEPTWQSKGLGSKILQKEFEKIAIQEKNAVLALSTQRYWTVKFYQRLGFEIILEDKIGSDELAFTNWTMKKILP
ncbi:MAG: GNAT family N-acetyltransferase [Bacteroidota bacterium]